MMSPITIITLGIAIICLASAALFHFLKEKGAHLVSGFDSIPESEKKNYDRKRMSLEMRNKLLIWGTVLLAGSVLSQVVHDYFGVGALGLFFILVVNSFGPFDVYKNK